MRILHVEDDQDTRSLVAFILQGEGWEVVSVEDTSAAIKLARAGDFDLYLIDNWVEGDNQNALCLSLRSLDPHTPILFYSGAVFPADFNRGSRLAHRATLKSRVLPKHSSQKY